jgi:DNA primase
MDVVTLWQQGIRNCTATLGTSTSAQPVLRLFQATTNLLYCFDGDKAGRCAAWRALERTLPVLRRGRRVHFLILPDGEDPDFLVRKGGIQALQSLADEALSLPMFLSRELAVLALDARDILHVAEEMRLPPPPPKQLVYRPVSLEPVDAACSMPWPGWWDSSHNRRSALHWRS